MMFIRTAGVSDLPAIRALLTETWHATYDAIYGVDRVTAISDDWHSIPSLKARLDRPDAEFIVADDGAEIAGVAFASVVDNGKTVELSQLYVTPGRQGQGIGGMLLDEIIDSFPDAERIRLEVEPANARAVAFYAAQGFVEIGRTENCGGDLSGIAALILERALA